MLFASAASDPAVNCQLGFGLICPSTVDHDGLFSFIWLSCPIPESQLFGSGDGHPSSLQNKNCPAPEGPAKDAGVEEQQVEKSEPQDSRSQSYLPTQETGNISSAPMEMTLLFSLSPI